MSETKQLAQPGKPDHRTPVGRSSVNVFTVDRGDQKMFCVRSLLRKGEEGIGSLAKLRIRAFTAEEACAKYRETYLLDPWSPVSFAEIDPKSKSITAVDDWVLVKRPDWGVARQEIKKLKVDQSLKVEMLKKSNPPKAALEILENEQIEIPKRIFEACKVEVAEDVGDKNG